MEAAPGIWTRLTHWANVAVWHVPLPRRARARLSKIVYRNPPMSPERARETLVALEQAGVSARCFGGWGVDALAGGQSRTHRDLDLLVDGRDLEAALRALGELGYREWYRLPPVELGGQPIGEQVVVRDPAMRVVDLHPVHLQGSRLGSHPGEIAGHPVACVSAEDQMLLRTPTKPGGPAAYNHPSDERILRGLITPRSGRPGAAAG